MSILRQQVWAIRVCQFGQHVRFHHSWEYGVVIQHHMVFTFFPRDKNEPVREKRGSCQLQEGCQKLKTNTHGQDDVHSHVPVFKSLDHRHRPWSFCIMDHFWVKQCHVYHPWLGMVYGITTYQNGDDSGVLNMHCFTHITPTKTVEPPPSWGWNNLRAALPQ